MQKDDMSTSSLDMRPYKIVDVQSTVEAVEILNANCDAEQMSFDLETTGFDFIGDKIGCVTCSFDGETGYYIPWEFVNKRTLAKCLMSAKCLVAANGKFDCKFLWKNGVAEYKWTPTDDTMIFSQGLNSDRHKGLKSLAFFYTRFGGYDNMLDAVKKSLKVDNYMEIPHEHLMKYATLDAIVTWRIYKSECEHARRLDKKIPNDKLKDWTVERWYRDVMIPYYREVIELEYRGFYVNEDQRKRAADNLRTKISSLRQKLCDMWNPVLTQRGNPPIPVELNFFSSKQLGVILEQMGWPKVQESEDGGYSTNDVCQTEWKRLGFKGVDELGDMRSFNTALGSFVGYSDAFGKKFGWEQFVRAHDDGTFRMHPSVNVMGTSTYRCSVHEPSTQNIATYGEVGKMVKQCLCSPIMTPNYSVTDDCGKLWEGRGSDFLVTRRGEVRFCDLAEDDEILEYGRKTLFVEAV
jgi:DNA polymerase I-like protein with 3'-5' exonuclease and polymerase domains